MQEPYTPSRNIRQTHGQSGVSEHPPQLRQVRKTSRKRKRPAPVGLKRPRNNSSVTSKVYDRKKVPCSFWRFAFASMLQPRINDRHSPLKSADLQLTKMSFCKLLRQEITQDLLKMAGSVLPGSTNKGWTFGGCCEVLVHLSGWRTTSLFIPSMQMLRTRDHSLGRYALMPTPAFTVWALGHKGI